MTKQKQRFDHVPLGVAPNSKRLSINVSLHGMTIRLICSSDSTDELRLYDGERTRSN